jgi:hypothetical protein
MKLHSLVPNFYIRVSVSYLYIPTISPLRKRNTTEEVDRSR